MSNEQHQFLALLARPPARLTMEQTAWFLGFQPHDIPVLVTARLLKPLGNPPVNGIKYFSYAEILEFSQNREWLARATNAIHQHWHRKNQRKEPPSLNGQ